MTGPDAKIFFFINKGCSNTFFDHAMPLITFIGDGKFVAALAILLVIIIPKPKKIAAILLFAGLVVSHFAVHTLKNIFARPRPFMALENVNLLVRELDKSHSFPSGHATLAFMAAAVLANYFKRGYIFFIAAAAVAVSRVYVGVHYASDVIAGALLGAAIGYSLVYAVKKVRRE